MPSWKVVAGTVGLGLAGMGTLVGVAYAKTPVPDTGNADATKTSAIFYYADGKTEIGRLGKNRELIKIGQVPRYVQDAVIAAENRSFRTDSGFSAKGLTRAVWNNLTGGETQGGSTITQQLAKNYYLSDQRTMSRKFKEMFISLKLEDKLGSKDRILELYLNTIYFGRNAYGIQAASKAFFGKDVGELTPDEGALIAAVINRPGRLDPRSDDPKARDLTRARYLYVLDGMRKSHTLTQADYDKYSKKLPTTKPMGGPEVFGGQRGYMINRALLELQRQGIDQKTVVDQGLKVYTTFDKRKMAAAKRAVETTVPGVDPKKLAKKHVQLGLVSVNTRNGEVEAIYGGTDYLDDQYDNVWYGSAQAGSAMKPYTLAAALEKGYSLKSLVEGRSGLYFDGNGNVVPRGRGYGPIPNSHPAKGGIDLLQAMKQSTNSAFFQLAGKTGIRNVARAAEKAGVDPSMVEPYARKGQVGLTLGINDLRPIEQAAGYATFASGGTYHQPHVVRDLRNRDGQRVRRLTWKTTENAFSAGVTADVTAALQGVVKPGGTGVAAALPDRPVAGKTGTTDNNIATWFVGYVPKISTAVTMYNDKRKPLIVNGAVVEGGSVPARIWHAYMAQATAGTPVDQFPPAANIGTQQKWAQVYKPPKHADKPKWCKGPLGGIDPRCKGDNSKKPACDSPFAQNCDPNKPPSSPPPQWWCAMHPGEKACRRGGGGRQRPGWPYVQQFVHEVPLDAQRRTR
ncbi:Penicillin-binding protein 1A [Actinomadura rubteroloni]|uniref:Penicillin-binding protein 1A n=1 Tax=Actinomadura rubteroloni TaxID=1926885 RepID=A0A2P4UMP5_9ACTN|nr:transglycosylase domain-containing protein [Actinomadura rubteroloni]POM26321.1 Penicillin-binding protein 1A [Actinomadura rubteroloni]